MANSIKVRAKAKGDEVEVKTLMTHAMEPGGRKDKKTGETIPPHFIQEVICTHNGNTVMTAMWSGGVSKNPYLAFKFTGGKAGDKIAISWVDNKGESDSVEADVG